jgi:hypothetical protein
LIALLAQHPLAPSSDEWLGRYAVHPSIASRGLWNTQHVDAEPLTPQEFERLAYLAHPSTD